MNLSEHKNPAKLQYHMKKLQFDNGDTYDIFSISYGIDKEGIPVDIVIYANQYILDRIAQEHGHVGYNKQKATFYQTYTELNIGFDEEFDNANLWEGLFARLDNFTVHGFRHATFN